MAQLVLDPLEIPSWTLVILVTGVPWCRQGTLLSSVLEAPVTSVAFSSPPSALLAPASAAPPSVAAAPVLVGVVVDS